MLKVKDHSKFALLDYISEPSTMAQLGEVYYKHTAEDTEMDQKEMHEIGVVIQTFEDGWGEFRTDMWGNGCLSEGIVPATLEQVKMYRPELLEDLLAEAA